MDRENQTSAVPSANDAPKRSQHVDAAPLETKEQHDEAVLRAGGVPEFGFVEDLYK